MTTATATGRLFAPSPAMDWARLSVASDIKQIEMQVDAYAKAAATWRAASIARLSQIGTIDTEAWAHGDRDINAAIEAVELGLKAHSLPLQSDPDVARKLREITEQSPAIGKLLSKMLERLERVRVAQHAVHVDLYYGLLALQSEFDRDDGEAEHFRDPESLGASLRSQLA